MTYARFSIQRQLEYPFALVGSMATSIFLWLWMGITFKLIIDNFQPLSGWTFGHWSFLYGLAMISRGVVQTLSFQSREIDAMVTRGEFDQLLVRPMNVTFQFAVNNIDLLGLAYVVVGPIYFAYGCQAVDFNWTITNVVKLLLVLIGGTLIYWSFWTLISGIAFWTKRSKPLVDGSMELLVRGSFYPLSIYPLPLQLLLTFIIPIGFISYYPTCDFLDYGDALPLTSAWLTPIVGIAMFVVTIYVFNAGLRRYESAGS